MIQNTDSRIDIPLLLRHNSSSFYLNISPSMSSPNLLPSALQSSLQELVERINSCGAGVNAILLSTLEGVPLGRVYAGNVEWHEEVLSSLETTWAPASKHFPLLNLGKEIQVVTAMYDQVTLLHVYLSPVVVTILASPNANIGAIRSTGIPLLKECLHPLCQTLLSSLSPEATGQAHPQAYYQ